MDLINQGKGPITKIWGISDEFKLRVIKIACDKNNVDFYNPTDNDKKNIRMVINIDEGHKKLIEVG